MEERDGGQGGIMVHAQDRDDEKTTHRNTEGCWSQEEPEAQEHWQPAEAAEVRAKFSPTNYGGSVTLVLPS